MAFLNIFKFLFTIYGVGEITLEYIRGKNIIIESCFFSWKEFSLPTQLAIKITGITLALEVGWEEEWSEQKEFRHKAWVV